MIPPRPRLPLARAPPNGPSSVGLLGKIKQRVGLHKKKGSKVIDNVNVSDAGNGKVNSSNTKTSTSNGNNNVSDISSNAKTSISGNNNVSDISSNTMTYISNGNSNVSNNAKTSSSESEYIGLGVLAGRENNSDMELEVES